MNQLSRDALIDTGDLSMGIRPNVGWISAEVWPFIKLEIGFYHTAIWDDSLYIYIHIYIYDLKHHSSDGKRREAKKYVNHIKWCLHNTL